MGLLISITKKGDGMFNSYYTVKLLAEKHPGFSESFLRYLIFNADKNGFDKCVVRIGRKVLIDEDEFLKWVKENNKTTTNS